MMDFLLKRKRIRCSVEGEDFKVVVPRRSKRAIDIVGNRVFKEKSINNTRRLFQKLGEPKCILDIGANIGYTALHYFYAVRPANIYAFEPSRFNFSFLHDNLAQISEIECYNFGFSNQVESGHLAMPSEGQNIKVTSRPHNTGYLSLYGDSSKYSEYVKLTTLDEWVIKKRILERMFIKIDVEGHELKVLSGAKKMLKLNHIFQIEFNPTAQMMSKTDPHKIIEFLSGYGYNGFLYEGDKFIPIDDKMLNSVHDIVFMNKMEANNYDKNNC